MWNDILWYFVSLAKCSKSNGWNQSMKDEGSRIFFNHRLVIGVAWARGGRDYMQDAFSVQLNKQARDNVLDYFGVFDGHGPNGENVARECALNLSNHVIALYEREPSFAFPQAIEMGCLLFDDYLRNLKPIMSPQDGLVRGGSTGCAVWVMGDLIYSGNVGDSRFILSYDGVAYNVSLDHKPTRRHEKQRVLKAGGNLQDGRINGELGVARSFGDFVFKEEMSLAAHEQLVTAVPDVRTVDIEESIDFLVIASDGIWDVLRNQEVVDMIINRMELKLPLHIICEEIINSCKVPQDQHQGYGSDNMTLLIAIFR